MKKLFAILALVLGMVSCQTEPEGLDVVVGDEQEVMLSVSLPEGTRAASSTGFDFTNFEQNAKYDLRFILEISYNGNVIRNVKTSNTTSTTFPVRLAPNREYTFTVWADLVEEGSNADLYYNTAAGLDKIEVNTVKWTANTEARDAFTNSIKHEFKAPNKNFGITLYRPFAKVRVVATDIQEILNFQIIPTSAEVAYTTDIYTGFNAVTGDVISDKKESVSHSFAYAGDDAVDTYTDVEGERTLFTDYIFVPTAGSTIQFILDVKDASGTTIKQNNFNTTIPVAKNKVTTIKGHVLTDGGDLSVDIENGFDTPGTDIEIWDGESQTEPEVIEDQTGALVAVVDTPSDLAWLAGYVNGTNNFTAASVAATRATTKINFVLGADIDLGGNEWTPIGTNAKHFDGTFDGNGHTIKGLRVTKAHNNGEQAALFGTMSGHPVIKNFVIDEAYIKYPNDGKDFYASAVAGTIYGFVTFENITVKNSTITGNNKVGAIFAHDGSSNKITINNCHVDNCYIASEDLKDGGNVGGLIGLFQTGSAEACKISNSSVKNSTIVGINSKNNGKRANSEFIGGILTKTNTNLVLENCVVENNDFSQTIDGTAAVTYEGAFPAQFIGGDREEKRLGVVVINGTRYEGAEEPKSVSAEDGNWYATVGEAITAGNTEITLGEGNFEMPNSLKNGAVIEGNGKETVLDMDKIFSYYNNVTFRNLTINAGTAGWKGLQHSENIAYDNCTINGQYFLYTKSTFTNCTFNIEGDAYNIWTWSAPEIKFEGCTFNCDGKALLVYHESDGSAVECVNCTFNSNGKKFDGKAAIEIDGTLSKADAKHVVSINNCEVNGFDAGNVSGNNIYNVKKGNKAEVIIDGTVVVYNASSLAAAVKGGYNTILGTNIAMTESVAISNANFTLDGNGKTITMTEGATNEFALFDITGGKATIKNVTFDGIKSGAVVRTVGVEFNAENVTAKNGEHTQKQGLFRLMGKSTIKNSTFKNNSCSMVITLNYDGANNDPQVVENCVFEGNTCNGTAVLYYVKGEKATINGNKFIGNTVNCSNNGATIYMGFTENNVVTNNLFQNNTVNEAGESSRVAGGVFFGYETVFTGNAFISNKVTGTNAKGNDVCVSTYYTSIDLSGNYWGGNAPVEDTNYFVQHKSDERVVIINNYLTTNPIN